MDINFKDEESTKKEYNSAIDSIITGIEETGQVSTETVLSIECELGAGTIPNNIRNRVSESPSKHGYRELLEFAKSTQIRRPRSNMNSVYHYVYNRLKLLNKYSIDNILATVQEDLLMLTTLYVPKNINNLLTTPATNVGELPVSYLIHGTLASDNYSDVESITLKYLRGLHGSVAFGSLEVITGILDGCSIDKIAAMTNISYGGSVSEYLNTCIKLLTELNSKNISEECGEVAACVDNINTPLVNKSDMTNISIILAVLDKDTFILGQC